MPARNRRWPPPEVLILAGVAAAQIALHLLLPEYGFHGDELYNVTIADGFSWANLDMPPVAPLLLKAFLLIFGHSIKTVHLAAATCGAAVMTLGCLMAREFGGRRYAMILTGSFLLLSGLVIFGSLYLYDDPSFVLWAAVLYVLLRMLNGGARRGWLVIGVLLGLGLLTKLTVLFLGLAIFVSLWLVRERTWFRERWIWLAAVIAFALSLPYAIWQGRHGWYFLSYAASYAGRTTHASPALDFLWSQVFPNNIFLLPVWATGLGLLLFSGTWKKYRLFGFVYVALCLSVFALGGQFYFMMPIYTLLVAVGSVWIERRFESMALRGGRHAAWKIAVPVGYLLLSLPFLPRFVPLLPPDQLVRYVRLLGVTAGIRTSDARVTNLPQHFANRFGWEEMMREVAAVYRRAPGAARDSVGIMTSNYCEASAVHVHGTRHGLPEALCDHGWFYFEGARRNVWRSRYVAIGVSEGRLRSLFRDVRLEAVFRHPLCMPHESDNAIYLCSDPRVDLRRYWAVTEIMDPEFERTLRRDGAAAALALYRERRARDPGVVLFTERQLNTRGYEYLGRHRVKEAIALFELNVEAYPESFNVYDSLGEALMADHQYAEAARSYRRSVELDPANENGRRKLDELKALMAARPAAGTRPSPAP